MQYKNPIIHILLVLLTASIVLIGGCIGSQQEIVTENENNISFVENETPENEQNITEIQVINQSGGEMEGENKTEETNIPVNELNNSVESNESIKQTETGETNKSSETNEINESVGSTNNTSEIETNKSVGSDHTDYERVKRIKFDISDLKHNRDAQELEDILKRDINGVIYGRTSFADKNGEAVYDTSKITNAELIEILSVLKTPSGYVVQTHRVTITEEVNCTKSGSEYRCCNEAKCGFYHYGKF
ncbi:MAG: hypothetical protein CVT90_02880 [Candidatus Altiarchaeales archaeon HGW-Altiarchaeales-3]|nr:MAG: hypothetical protein CVT90_02880 [Candidatus Altiarchaeales archaeon HGW-Altiarchaeales-3]